MKKSVLTAASVLCLGLVAASQSYAAVVNLNPLSTASLRIAPRGNDYGALATYNDGGGNVQHSLIDFRATVHPRRFGHHVCNLDAPARLHNLLHRQ